MQLVRRAGVTATAEPLLRPGAQNSQDRLGIAIIYGDLRVIWWTSQWQQSAGLRSGIWRWTTSPQVLRRKALSNTSWTSIWHLRKHKADHCLRQHRLPSSLDVRRPGPWIKAATPEPKYEGILESEHIWRPRLAKAQAKAVTCRLFSMAPWLSAGPAMSSFF
jgi:hypothetical protein